jgi:hypothetical protein
MSNGEAKEQTQADSAAGNYAWEYFKYHAGQRQSVFRFYLTLVGVATLAYAYSQRFANSAAEAADQGARLRPLIGLAFVIVSFLFWRLDKRSQHLIKLAETALKNREETLSKLINDPDIRLMQLGDEKCTLFPYSELETFRQVYGCIFLLIGLVGTLMVDNALGMTTLAIFILVYFAIFWKRYRSGRIRFGSVQEYLERLNFKR